jgi:putative nucleotidyltransferase with HDIG domain
VLRVHIGQGGVVLKGQGRLFEGGLGESAHVIRPLPRGSRSGSPTGLAIQTRTRMSVHAINQAERARISNAEHTQPMRLASRRGELIVGTSFMAAAVALPLVAGLNRGLSLKTALLYVVGIAVAGQVRFDTGAGFTVPTQAVFVPMLFAVPVAVVPLLVAAGLALGTVPRVLRGEIAPSWLLTAASNSWFAVGPAIVLVHFAHYDPIGHWGILILALGAQFAFDFSASAARVVLEGDLDVRTLPIELGPIYVIDSALSVLGLAIAFATIPVHSQIPALFIAPMFGILRFFSQERRQRLEQLVELSDAYQGTALLLGDVVEADDAYTGVHCKSVVRLSLDVADRLGLDADIKRNVEFGALLHDIGKIAVPKEIINKPGELDQDEWALIKMHTVEGQKMLDTIGGFMREIGRIVRASHERWDGSGYPDGLSGEQIPIEARIVSACDAFNAMTTTRSYREAMPESAAIDELACNAGSQFDPHVVRSLLAVLSASPSSATVNHQGETVASVGEVVQLRTM